MINIIQAIKTELIILIFAMTPIFELRGAIPLGISLGLHPVHSGIISVLGNMLVLFLLLKLLQPLMDYFEKTYLFNKTIGWVKKRSMKKAGIIKKYSLIGLFLFVAIPLPTTGAWTGSVIATILKLDSRKAFFSMSAGIIMAAMIILGIYYGVLYKN